MTLPNQIVDREYQKFIDVSPGETAVRVGNDGAPFITTSSIGAPTIANIVIAAANTEQSYSMPASTKRYLIKPRGNGSIKLAHVSGQSGTNYLTIWPGAVYDTWEIKADTYSVYFQSPVAGLVVEIESWA